MNIKNDRGVTLISLTIYVVLMLAVVAVMAGFKDNIDKTLKTMGEYASVVPEINKMHMYMLDEANIENNKILKRNSDGTYVEFTSGNKYLFSENKVYKNSVRILTDVSNCTFEVGQENNNDVLYVNLEVGSGKSVSKKLRYVML